MKQRLNDRDLAERIANHIAKSPSAGRGPAAAARVLLQRARSASGSVRAQYLAAAQRAITNLDPVIQGSTIQRLQAEMLALHGRGGDSKVAHLTPGEIVVPRVMQTPEFLHWFGVTAQAHGIDPARQVVGSGRSSVNPDTGQEEFFDDDGEEIEGITVTTPRDKGFAQLPQNPPYSGYYNFGTPEEGKGQYGNAATLEMIGAVGNRMNAMGMPQMGVGNMSLSDGSIFKPHSPTGGHTTGTSVDIRPYRTDGQQAGVSWKNPDYDREATQRLVDTMRAMGGVKSILFNDPNIRGVTPSIGHDDHLHVTVNPLWKR